MELNKRKIVAYALPIFVVLITFVSTNQWSSVPLGNTTVIWIVDFATIATVFWYKRKFFKPANPKDFWIIKVFLFWMLIGTIRGMFVADNYWEWKQLIAGTTALSLPVFVYVFSIPWVLHNVLKVWMKYAIPLFFLFFFFVLTKDSYHFYLGPVFLLASFLPVVPTKKWQLVLIALLLMMLFADFGARSQVIKSVISILMSLAYLFRKFLSDKILRTAFWLLLFTPLVLLFLGISGQFNLFQDMSSNKGKYIETKVVDGEVVNDDLAADTRTFIYEEVIGSALRHGYLWWGRTPARGNDSVAFGTYNAEELKTGKYERHSNELCFPNIFTWLGLVGMLLYVFIYLKSAYLAVYKSKSTFMKLIGVFIAFHFAYGWVEDINHFDIANIALWMSIAMGFSDQFRKMNDSEFKRWFNLLFSKQSKKIAALA